MIIEVISSSLGVVMRDIREGRDTVLHMKRPKTIVMKFL